MDAGVHLPQLDLLGSGLSLDRIVATTVAAREAGFVAVSANDHLVYPRPWLDCLVALGAALPESGTMELATTVLLPVLRGAPAAVAALSSLQRLAGGDVLAGLGPGSSEADYAAAGIPWQERWSRFEDAVVEVRAGGFPVWLGSWGSPAGLRRVARLGDGWFASSYNTDPERFGAALAQLGAMPHALVTMWTWVTRDQAEVDRMIEQVLAPFLRRDPGVLRDQLCVGTPEHCAALLSRYAAAGCTRVHFWPLGQEAAQVRLLASEVLPRVASAGA